MKAAVAPIEVDVEERRAGVDGAACRVAQPLARVAGVGRDADDEPRRGGVVEPAGPGDVLGKRHGALLAAAAQPVRGEAGAVQAVHHVGAVGEGADVAEDAGAVLAPGAGDQDMLDVGALGAREQRRFVQFVEQSQRQQQQPGADVQFRFPQVVDVGEFDRRAAGLAGRGVLELEPRVEHPAFVELVADVDDAAQEVDDVAEADRRAAFPLAGVALEQHLAVAADGETLFDPVDLGGRGAQAVHALAGNGPGRLAECRRAGQQQGRQRGDCRFQLALHERRPASGAGSGA